ncbi:hypothetical protein EB809_00385 [Marinobacter sp. R17]|uniref:putative metalloprotease CJM1_0395 family protein n=1 Tax=Marinobacter sp. R17 TaxID=2484250 RepID=UPI000F4BEB4B|nr:hypothetical protein EB809_00385 [Marinobacter sp. R17]
MTVSLGSIGTSLPYATSSASGQRSGAPSNTADASPAKADSPTEAIKARAQGAESDASLDDSDLAELRDLKSRDREVRAHESAHQSAGGQHAGAASFTYTRGPDGAQYATEGEVPIDISPVSGNPQATIDKMRTVRAAALAPAQPSSQDRQVAAQAMQILLQAQVERAEESGRATSSAGAEEGDTPASASHAAGATYRRVEGLTGLESDEPATAFQATA